MIDTIEDITHRSAKMCQSPVLQKPPSHCQKYLFQHSWEAIYEEIPLEIACKTGQNALTYQIVTHITSPHINPVLLLVSNMDYMYHADAVLPIDIGCAYFYAFCTEHCLVCEERL